MDMERDAGGEPEATLLQSVAAVLPDVVYVVRLGPEPDMEFVSSTCAAMFGYTEEEFGASPELASSLIEPDDLAGVARAVRERSGDGDLDIDLRMRTRDGRVIWTQHRCRIHTRTDGTQILSGVARDITAAHAAQAALAESEARYRLFAENASDVVLQVGPDATYRWCSPSSLDVLGWDPSELVGRRAEDFVHPDDLDRVIEAREHPHDGYAAVDEFRFRRADGTYLWVSGRLRDVRDDAGLVHSRVVALRDVHEQVLTRQARIESEARYRLLAENASDIVWQTIPDGTIVWTSPSVERILRWRPDQIVGTLARDLITAPDRATVQALRTALYGGEPIEPLESRFRMGDGEQRWLSSHATPITDETGAVTGSVIAMRDCEAEVRARRALTTLSAGNAILLRADDEDALLGEMCQTAVDQAGYAFAWYARIGEDGMLHAGASSREHSDLLDRLPLVLDDGSLGQGPALHAAMSGRTYRLADLLEDADFAAWRDLADQRGFRSVVALPVQAGDRADGVLVVYAGERDAFDARSTAVLEDLALQLGHGLHRLRVGAALDRSLADRALLATAIDQAAEAILVADATPRIVYANPAAVRSSGYALDELIGADPRALDTSIVEHLYSPAVLERLGGGQSWRGVVVSRRRDGEHHEEEVSITPVYDEDDQVVAYVTVRRDLAVERRLEADLDRGQRDRLVLVDLMGKVRPALTVDGTAIALTNAVQKLDDIDAARVFQIDETDRVVPLGAAGIGALGWEAGMPIEVEGLDDVVAHTREGAWWITPGDRHPRHPRLTEIVAERGFTCFAVVPIRTDGLLRGGLAVASRHPDAPTWIEARLGILEEIASFGGILFATQADQQASNDAATLDIRRTIADATFHTAFQPIVDLASGTTLGYEALTRFADGTRPDLRIAEAHKVGLGVELETACAAAAIAAARRLPAGTWVSVNLSPAALVSGRAAEVLADADRQVVVEITEHHEIENYAVVRRAIRACGPVRLSVDDAGSGFASLRHILELEPDLVKLDIELVRAIDRDPARQALAAGLCHFAAQTGTTLIAEGVETEAEAAAIRELGVPLAQGFLFGRPEPAPA